LTCARQTTANLSGGCLGICPPRNPHLFKKKENIEKNGKQPKQGKRGQAKPKQTTTAQQLEQLSVRVCEMCRNSIKATFYG